MAFNGSLKHHARHIARHHPIGLVDDFADPQVGADAAEHIRALGAHAVKHAETIDGFHSEVEASALEFLALKNQISILQPGKTLDDLQTGMLRIVTSIGKTFRLSLLAFLYYVLILLFELLFFPLLSAVILYKFTVFALGRVFDTPRPPAPTPVHPPVTL